MADEDANKVPSVVILILAILLPPLGVLLKDGFKVSFFICLLLCLFGYLPGVIYAIWVVGV